MRQILEMNEAKNILHPYLETIAQGVSKGFNDYKALLKFYAETNQRPLGINKKIKSGFINGLIAERILESFKGMSGVTVKDYKGVFGLHIRNQLFLRFKKFNSHLSPSVSRTRQTQKIDKQQTVIPGFPRKPTFLYVGYTFDKTYSELTHIYISLRVRGRKEWLLDITEHASESSVQNIIPFNSVKANKGARIKVRDNAKKVRKAS